MKKQHSFFTFLLLLIALLLWAALWKLSKNDPTAAKPDAAKRQPTLDTELGKMTGKLNPGAEESRSKIIAAIFEKLRRGEIAPGELNAFRDAILGAPKDEAIAAILEFLATGLDARTTEIFQVGPGGQLTGSPTLRVLLLDLLGRIARDAGTDEAQRVAQEIFRSKSSADEWAVALRNMAWRNPVEREALVAKTREMLEWQPWRQQPSAGFREAFDLIVFTQDVAYIPELAEMLAGEDAELQRSAGMALDRLSQMTPQAVMNFLNTNPAQLANLPFLRADYFSKADLSQPAQRASVEMYLSRQDVALEEKQKLIAAFASPGSFAADSLVSEAPADELPAGYSEGLRRSVNEWLATNRFPNLAVPLRDLYELLAE